ncbi:UDP-N-acetylmuramoyl-tripeptide--D-alanyl-D-alanine ligase [Candidatus Nitrosacidococcus tergens]|uniref:UDP-N-acetylmuramoyl-tripeptide--D-alanyl-D-alanine ligase n=1 Tax=Candidatus Nitrosacidococcus tergens TaxID=553981 RepID=A0A7G1QBW6_9GAMM|nr:UDP-N-acetylmuramoyl-tripeptide--D-alanyl-D-alanine ligase [Candidatus Nitrosacidococcus tergens]CAB1276940.1 UDP-N-acetylmuramoyl-tripeptide:D-alanyl-D-alanine ligase [Candidatus Nitrosacidococcus tergens]
MRFIGSLTEITQTVQGQLRGGGEITVSGISTDSRLNDLSGTLFISLQGEKFNGHNFIYQALEKGASAVLVEEFIESDIPQIKVVNTCFALGKIGSYWRKHFKIPIVAITGSNGKTTTKEMVSSILSKSNLSLSTQGNLNNQIGVPLTLLQLNANHRFAVIEMGANHSGEINYLSQLVCPQIALITNAGSAHLSGFKDLNGVAQAKGEIFQGVSSGGIGVLNRDDPYFFYWHRLAMRNGLRVISFGLGQSAMIYAADLTSNPEGTEFTLFTPKGTIRIPLPLLGTHNVVNALAASAVAFTLGLKLDQIYEGLITFSPAFGRLQVKYTSSGARILDDTYNGNPSSFQAALEVLAQFTGDRILVLGDFAELGEKSIELHEDLGQQARSARINQLYTLGNFSAAASKSFGCGGKHFFDQQTLIVELQKIKTRNTTILIKGSRFMNMEQIVTALCT